MPASNKPKCPITPYAAFVKHARVEQKKSSDAQYDFATFSKNCAERWKNLGTKDRKKFEDISKKDRARYNNEMADYEPPANETKGKKQKKDPNCPKRAQSAFFFFCDDERPKVRSIHPDWNVTDIAKELGKRWAVCKSKPKYESLAQEAKKKYIKAMADYKKAKGDN